MGHAVTLTRWIGTSPRPVTPGGLLRKGDVPAAGAALGVDVPSRLRTIADIPALHRPWCAAVGTGLLRVGDGSVTAGPALESWPPGHADLLAGWLAALRRVCAAESRPHDEDSVLLLVLTLLQALGQHEGALPTRSLHRPVFEALQDLCGNYDKWFGEVWSAADRYADGEAGTPLAGLVTLLAGFGAVGGDPGKPEITPLGRWAAEHIAAGLPGPADADVPAEEMIARAARFSDEEHQYHVARKWLAGRGPVRAAREILTAADGMTPLLRIVAADIVERLGEDALPAWRQAAKAPRIGPLARLVLADWDQGPEPSDADRRWLAVEGAAAALAEKGPDEALSLVWERMSGEDLDARLAAVRATGHPDAEALAQAVAEFAASGAPLSIDQMAQLKVSLIYYRPAIWRRVRLPVTVTLADLHQVIQVLFGWDGDHLHVFQAGNKQYSSSFVNLEGAMDEGAVRIRDVLAPNGKIKYVYDLGAYWQHEITLEKILPCDPGQDFPVCVQYKGDSPVEYWSEEDPEEPEPFDQAEVNRKLARLAGAEE
jgi:Plasmid pRiA4b ORF-3-like protein